MSLPMHFVEVFSELDKKREDCLKALQAGEYVWAAYYANDLEALTKRLITYTHTIVERKYADPQAALKRHPDLLDPSTKGN